MAVIQRTECKGCIRLSQGIILVLVLMGARGSPLPGCEEAKRDFQDAGLPGSWLLDAPVGDQTCGRNSCCSKQAEQDMFAQSKRQLDSFLRDSITRLSSLIDSRAKKFDGLFREMMNTSRIEFHDMFKKTYGKIYLQNSDVFSDFFKELESYYKKGATRLSDTLESFFVILYQRMFTVLNAQYTFDEKYLDCVSEHMKDVKPFGDVPQKFTLQLRRSFIATRTYYKSLATAAESAKRLASVGIERDCEKEMVRMRFCGSCTGQRGVGTCSNYCATVLQACLRHHVAFSAEWDNFIDALDKVADRLVGPYNIESVVEPLNIKISEAVMIFQDSGADVSQKIYTMCGKPTPARRRREVDDGKDLVDDPSYEINYTPLKKITGQGKKKKNKKHEEEDEGPSLERLIKEIKAKVKDTRQFWAHLPYQYCNNLTAPPSSDGKCWNGTSVGEFQVPVKAFASNSSLVKDQIYVLQTYTDKLRKAYHGEEVDLIDDTEDAVEGSGSGSGDFEIDTDEHEEVDKVVPRVDNDFESVDEGPRVETPTSSPPPDTKGAPTGGAASMSLNRALAQYLVPIVLVWFGGAISDLL